MNFSEREFEDWLFENPAAMEILGDEEFHWIGRQVQLPSGVADLIGRCGVKIFVVELKSENLKSQDVAQVLRYASDVREAIPSGYVESVLIGLNCDDKVLFSADATGVEVRMVECRFRISQGWEFNDEAVAAREVQLNALFADVDEEISEMINERIEMTKIAHVKRSNDLKTTAWLGLIENWYQLQEVNNA